MNPNTTPTGIAFTCTIDGIITDVIKNDLNIGNTDLHNKHFLTIFDESNIEKGNLFLDTLVKDNLVLGWQINTISKMRLINLSFTGIVYNDTILVTCATSRPLSIELLQHILLQYEIPSPLMNVDPQILNNLENNENQRDSEMFELLTKLNNELIVIQRRLAKQNIELDLLNTEKDSLIKDLQEAISHIKILSGLLPICANCKKIRDDKGYWNSLEKYITTHTNATFTHGICPDCAKHLYPDVEAMLNQPL